MIEGPENGFYGGAVILILHADGDDLDGVAQCRFGVRCGRMDSRRRTTLSGVVVASMAERPGTVHATVQL